MPLRMEPGQTYQTWADFKAALDAHCEENKCLFSISNAKTVEQANRTIKKAPYFDIELKYASCILVCKHYGSYTSASKGLRPRQRTYKTNCKAYINISACRKENYLIIRDSCHLHTHPCIEEVYSSYPEVRRMSKDEKKIVGFLMDLGVSPSQVKTAVGRHVTHKDLHNAKSQLKTLRQVQKKEACGSDSKSIGSVAGVNEAEGVSSAFLSRSEESSSGEWTKDGVEEGKMLGEVETSIDTSDSAPYIVSVAGLQDSLQDGVVEESGGDQTETTGLTGLLAAAGINSESVVVTMNSETGVKEEGPCTEEDSSAYTVTLCLPGGDVSKKGNNLQELLKGLPLGKIVSKPSSNVTLLDKEKFSQEEEPPTPNYKLCTECKGYVSPLDPHDRCLNCLGPEHIQEESCEHCKSMSAEQFNIRRKKMVALRMKALKALQQKRKLEEVKQPERLSEMDGEVLDSNAETESGQRKSKRIRKPKSFGPDVSIESVGRKKKSSSVNNHETKSSLNPVVKTEPLYEYEDNFSGCESHQENASDSGERFAHILSQTSVFDDVVRTELDSGVQVYSPVQDITKDFHRLMRTPNLPAVPPSLQQKYKLDPKFEADFCSPPDPLQGSPQLSQPGVDIINSGLCKLAANAVTNTRLAIYDKLFTRLGVGMADEALFILSELNGRITRVTEISQEDLTSNLQTAMDTIQALKDVLEELGDMSKDAVQTAAYQRSISLQSLSQARATLQAKQRSPRDSSLPRRSKFTPFSTKKISQEPPIADSNILTETIQDELSITPNHVEVPVTALSTASVEVLSTSQTDLINSTETTEVPIITMSGQPSSIEVATMSGQPSSIEVATLSGQPSSIEVATMSGQPSSIEVATEPETTFINMDSKLYSIAPITIASDLFHSFT